LHEGSAAGRWLDRHHPDLSPKTIADWRELLYDDEAIVEYLHRQGLVLELATDMPADTAQEVELRIPGTPLHVHVSAIKEPQLNEIITLFGGLGLGEHRFAITLTGLQALGRRFSLLKSEFGERSIAEALNDAKPPTADAVAGVLHGAPCRHPRAGCRYMRDGTCTIVEPAVTGTLEDLARRGIVHRLNAVAPYEYAVTI
jgi:hypothetical protein